MRRQLKGRVVALLGLDDSVVVTVNELQCSEPGCPPIETVIGVLAPGANRQFKVHKPLMDVTDHDLQSALRGEHDHG
ncbi:MAG: hypothetical protein AB7T06_26465 [Kofleriaceae bacterium]